MLKRRRESRSRNTPFRFFTQSIYDMNMDMNTNQDINQGDVQLIITTKRNQNLRPLFQKKKKKKQRKRQEKKKKSPHATYHV